MRKEKSPKESAYSEKDLETIQNARGSGSVMRFLAGRFGSLSQRERATFAISEAAAKRLISEIMSTGVERAIRFSCDHDVHAYEAMRYDLSVAIGEANERA